MLRGWDGPALLGWANPTRAAKPSFPWVATVCYCGTAKCQCCHELQIWMKIESAWLINWLLKQNRDPTWYYMYPTTITMHLYANLYGMINIPTYMIISCRSTSIDSYLKIYEHVVAFEFLGKRWCQRVNMSYHRWWNYHNLSIMPYDKRPYGGFLSHGGTPSSHPFIDGCSMK